MSLCEGNTYVSQCVLCFSCSCSEWLTKVSPTKMDLFIEANVAMPILLWRVGCILSAEEIAKAWEESVSKKHANGEHMVFEYTWVLPHLSKRRDNKRLRRVFAEAGVDFHNAVDMHTSHEITIMWSLPDETAFSFQ